LLLSATPVEGVASAGGAEVAEASVDSVLVFFFFADLDSDLTAGFWVVEAAIVKIWRGSRRVERVVNVCGTEVLFEPLLGEF
jgi:hypothetical protein